MAINDNLQNAVAQVLLAAIQTAKQTGDWMKGQLPDVVHQLMTWRLVSDIVSIVLALVFITFFALSAKKFTKLYAQEKAKSKDRWFDATDMPGGIAWIVWLIIGGVVTIAFFVIAVANIYDALEIWFAPKVWLLEYAAHLLKSAN